MQAIGLPTTNTADIRPLDLGSLRAGGATWMLSISEDGEMVRRRGALAFPAYNGNLHPRDFSYPFFAVFDSSST